MLRFQQFENHNLLELNDESIAAAIAGHLILRQICRVFDECCSTKKAADDTQFSRAI